MKKLFRKKRTWVLLILALLLFLWWFGTFTLTTTKVTLTSGKVKNDITIVQLTDLHGARFGRDNAALIRLIEKQEPGSDRLYRRHGVGRRRKGRQTALSLLSRLAEDYPVYFVNGEHDHTPAFLDSLREAGVHVLDYTTETVTVGDTTLRLYGATSLYYSPTYDLTNEFTLDEEHYTILLAHIPNREKFAAFGTDLALCGDTHGGRCGCPLSARYIIRELGSPDCCPTVRRSMTKACSPRGISACSSPAGWAIFRFRCGSATGRKSR